MAARKREADERIDPPDLPDEPERRELVVREASRAGVRFDSCVVQRAEIDRASLPNLQLLDVRVERCTATNGTWAKPIFRRVEIMGARLTGLTLAEAELSDVVFRECKADLLRIASSHLTAVRFERCSLAELDFEGSRLERVAFAGCDLKRAAFRNARLDRIDLRGSEVSGLDLAPAQFPSLTIDPSQAMDLVQSLGARIR